MQTKRVASYIVVGCIVGLMENPGTDFNTICTDICTAFFSAGNKPIHFIY